MKAAIFFVVEYSEERREFTEEEKYSAYEYFKRKKSFDIHCKLYREIRFSQFEEIDF